MLQQQLNLILQELTMQVLSNISTKTFHAIDGLRHSELTWKIKEVQPLGNLTYKDLLETWQCVSQMLPVGINIMDSGQDKH